MATHSSILAWRIPGTGEPRGLPSMGTNGDGPQFLHLYKGNHNLHLMRSLLGSIEMIFAKTKA